MTSVATALQEQLLQLTRDLAVRRYVVAFSGGLDSTVLLHALVHSDAARKAEFLAVHIDHGLHERSGGWSQHCRDVAAELDVAFESIAVTVEVDSGTGPEAAARNARYAAFRRLMRSGDCLLSAHHREDQAETLLLRLLRGSGPVGLAAIAARQSFGCGHLLRPLLDVSRDDLQRYATRHTLRWIEDPSNADPRFDRNFLRLEVLPLLARRWPAATARLARSASLAREARELLDDLADQDLADHPAPARLSLAQLLALPEARQRNALRRAIALCGLPVPPAGRLQQAVSELLTAREDAQPLVTWEGGELRRYRGELFVLAATLKDSTAAGTLLLPGDRCVALGPGLGSLCLKQTAAPGVDPEIAAAGLRVRFRRGGEDIRPVGHRVTHKLKKLLQQEGVVPWMRERIPLLYAGEQLVAVADLWLADDSSAPGGLQVHWCERPELQ